MPIPSRIFHAVRTTRSKPLASARLFVLLIVVAFSTGIAATVVSASALPPCRLADTLTKQRAYSDWNRTVIDDLRAMARAARAAGARLAVQSAFRSYSTQRSTFAYWSRVSGYAAALRS